MVPYEMACSKESFDDLNNNCQQNTKDDHRGDRKIKPEVFSFYPYVSRQATYPVKFIRKEIKNNANNHNDDPENNYIFAKLVVHSQTY